MALEKSTEEVQEKKRKEFQKKKQQKEKRLRCGVCNGYKVRPSKKVQQ